MYLLPLTFIRYCPVTISISSGLYMMDTKHKINTKRKKNCEVEGKGRTVFKICSNRD